MLLNVLKIHFISYVYILGIYLLKFTNGISHCDSDSPIFEIRPGPSDGNLSYLEIYCPCNENVIIDIYRGDDTISCITSDSYHGERVEWFNLVKYTNNSDHSYCFFTYDLQVTTERFYCATMIRTKCSTITYYTKTMEIQEVSDEHRTATIHISAININLILWIISGIFIVSIIGAFAVVFLKRYGRVKQWNSSSNVDESQDLLHLPSASLGSPPKHGNLFVVYYNDDATHLTAVQLFVFLLQEILHWNIVVGFNCMTDICTLGFASWISSVINSCDKIVVISSDAAYQQLASYQKTKKFPNSTEVLGNLLFYSWHNIISDRTLAQNYNRLFNIRFSYTSIGHLIPEIVNGRHFVMPNDLSELVYQLLDSTDEARTFATSLSSQLLSMPLYKDFTMATDSIADDRNKCLEVVI